MFGRFLEAPGDELGCGTLIAMELLVARAAEIGAEAQLSRPSPLARVRRLPAARLRLASPKRSVAENRLKTRFRRLRVLRSNGAPPLGLFSHPIRRTSEVRVERP